MENYLNELSNICKLPFGDVCNNFKVIWFGKDGIYISNFKKLIDYSCKKIVLKITNNTLEVSGENLTISQINKGEIVVTGKIQSIGLGVIDEKI